MIVDDEAGFCDFIGHYLANRGFEVVSASRASQALEMLSQQPFDVVLADIMMPLTDGLEMLRQIREMSPQVKVILMTAYASLDRALRAITYGAEDLLIKPFELADLMKALNGVLTKQSGGSESGSVADEVQPSSL